jgi:hypothetical protein
LSLVILKWKVIQWKLLRTKKGCHEKKLKWIQILKSEPESIFFNYNFNCENFIQVNVKGNTRKLDRPAKNQDELPPRYSSKLAISAAKKKNLLCKRGVLPELYHHYYNSLRTDCKAKDRLPMPDILDSDSATDEN